MLKRSSTLKASDLLSGRRSLGGPSRPSRLTKKSQTTTLDAAPADEGEEKPVDVSLKEGLSKSVRKSVVAFEDRFEEGGDDANKEGSGPASPKSPNKAAKKSITFGAEPEQLKVEKTMIQIPIFGQSERNFVVALASGIVSKVLAEEQKLCHQGHHTESFFLLLSGSASVTIDSNEVQKLNRGDWWGESQLYGLDNLSSATVTLQEETAVGEINRDDFLNVLVKYPVEQKFYDDLLASNKDGKRDGTLRQPSELLRGLSKPTLQALDERMVRRFYFPGQAILQQGSAGDSMVILVRGKASVKVDGKMVREVWRGNCDVEARSTRRASAGAQAQGRRGSFFESEPESRRTSSADTSARRKSSAGGSSAAAAAHPGLESLHDLAAKAAEMSKPDSPDSDTTSDESSEQEAAPGEEEEPVVFGELGLLGIQPTRTATVVANTICQIRILYRPVFLQALNDHNESLELDRLARFLKKRYTGAGNELVAAQPALQTLKEVAIFKEVGCIEPFLDCMAKHIEDRVYLVGQRIIEEDAVDDNRAMFILSQGKAKVLKGGEEVGKISAGAVFGEVVLLGVAMKRSTTVIAEEVCYAQILHQHVVVEALERFPEERPKVMLIAFKKDAEIRGLPCAGTLADGTPDWKANSVQAVSKAVQNSKIFGKIGEDFIAQLSQVAEDKIYMPGARIIEQGAFGDSLFIMISGTASVYAALKGDAAAKADGAGGRTQIGALAAGSICGELAMLGISKTRNATIEADTICVMWEITHDKAAPVIEAFPDARERFLASICSHLEHTVSNCIDGIQLFKKFDRKFRMLLGLYCDRRAFFSGQVIITEGVAGDGLHILNLGKARLERKQMPIMLCSAGAHFCTTNMLGIHKVNFCSLVATQTCHEVVISRTSYAQALEQYPSSEAAAEMAKQEQAIEDEFRESHRRLCAKGIVTNKKQLTVAEAFRRLQEDVSDDELLKRAWKQWKGFAAYSSKHRKAASQRRRWTRDWVQKQREAPAPKPSHSFREECDHMDEVDEVDKVASCMNVGHTTILGPLVHQRKPSKYAQLSSLYLGSRREWESMIFMPETPRQRKGWGFSSQPSSRQGSPRTPREARAVVLNSNRTVGGASWPGHDRSEATFSWDAASANL